MPKISCPFCGKEVGIIQFGDGYIAICCKQVIYNSKRLPDEKKIGLAESITDIIIPKKEN